MLALRDLVSGPVGAALWRASDLPAGGPVAATGFAALDAVLPGGGWPVGSLVELLQDAPHHHAWGLLAPGLARLADGQMVVVGAPATGFAPFGPALAGAGVAPERLLWVGADTPHGMAWATAQALRCRDVSAVLAWLPRARGTQLRQLQVAAHQHHKLLFVVRDGHSQREASPAPLRLLLQPDAAADATPRLWVRVLKRQGPPLLEAFSLPVGPTRLRAQLAASRSRLLRRRHDTLGLPPESQPEVAALPAPAVTFMPSVHAAALDRVAAAGG